MHKRMQGGAPLDIDREIFDIGSKSLKLIVHFNVKRPPPPLSPDPGFAPV
jgi:hypothetical protein